MADTQKERLPEKRVAVTVRCGDCLHFKSGPAAPSYSDICSRLGVQQFASPCKEYYPDVASISRVDGQALVKLAAVMAELKSAQKRALSVLMNRGGDWLEKAGRQFGEKVFFCSGAHCVANYFQAYVIGASRDGSTVFLSSRLNDLQKKPCYISVNADSVVSEIQFGKLKAALIKDNKVFEPRRTLQKTSLMDVLTMTKKELAARQKTLEQEPKTYIPPSIDDVPTAWLDKRRTVKLDSKQEKKIAKEDKVVRNKFHRRTAA